MPETFDNYLDRQRRNANSSLTNPGLSPEEYQLEEGEQPWGTRGEMAQRGIDKRVDRGNATADWLAWVNQDGDPYKRADRLRQVPSVDAWQNMDATQAQYTKNWESHNRGLERPILDPVEIPAIIASGGAPLLARTAVGKTLLGKGSQLTKNALKPTAWGDELLAGRLLNPGEQAQKLVPKLPYLNEAARKWVKHSVNYGLPIALDQVSGGHVLSGAIDLLKKPAVAVYDAMKPQEQKFWDEWDGLAPELLVGDPSEVLRRFETIKKKYDVSEFSPETQKKLTAYEKKLSSVYDTQPRIVPVSQPEVNQVETPPPLPLPIQQQAGGFTPHGPPGRV